MDESKIDLTDRLRRERRWAEASRYKDEAVRKLRAEGMKRREATEQAWREMAEAYPPVRPKSIHECDYEEATSMLYEAATEDAQQWQKEHGFTLSERAEMDLVLMLLVPYWCAGSSQVTPEAWRRQWEYVPR